MRFKLSYQTKSYLTVLGTSLIYFAMGLYFAAGNTGVYLTSYLIYRSNSDMKLDDAIWFLSAAGFSALLLPMGGWLEGKVGVRGVCMIGGLLQSSGIFATYFVLDTTFFWVVVVYGGSFLVSLASCYTSPMVNVCKWHPKHKGLVTGIGAASMALAPTMFTPLITYLVNPDNLPANELGLFDDELILERTKQSTIIQGIITATLFLFGIILTFPAQSNEKQSKSKSNKLVTNSQISLVSQKPQYCYSEPVFLVGFKNTFYEKTEAQSTTANTPEIQKHTHELNCDMDLEKHKSNLVLKELHQIEDLTDCSIEPRFAFRTSEFWLLSLKVLISELIFIYLLFMYKPYGQTFIRDDYFLSTVGAACAISNTLGRLTMGHVKDKLGYKAVSIPLSGIAMLSVSLMPLTRYLDKIFYGISVVLAVGSIGSQYALMPSAAQDSFGDKYASINIGFVYMSTVIATVSSALISQNLTSYIGWNGMIMLIATCAGLDFVATFFMPSDPNKRLIRRYKQYYAENDHKKTSHNPQDILVEMSHFKAIKSHSIVPGA